MRIIFYHDKEFLFGGGGILIPPRMNEHVKHNDELYLVVDVIYDYQHDNSVTVCLKKVS